MLVISRKVNEAVQIGPGITVIVTEIRPNRVKLAIQAPMELEIARDGTNRHQMLVRRSNGTTATPRGPDAAAGENAADHAAPAGDPGGGEAG